MTTENGMAKASYARSCIDVLWRRRDHLTEIADNEGRTDESYIRQEIAALTWALPVLEAEADALMRLNRRVRNVEQGKPDETE